MSGSQCPTPTKEKGGGAEAAGLRVVMVGNNSGPVGKSRTFVDGPSANAANSKLADGESIEDNEQHRYLSSSLNVNRVC